MFIWGAAQGKTKKDMLRTSKTHAILKNPQNLETVRASQIALSKKHAMKWARAQTHKQQHGKWFPGIKVKHRANHITMVSNTEDPKQIQFTYLSICSLISFHPHGDMFFTVRVVKPWRRQPRGVVEGPSPGIQGQIGPGTEQPGIVEDVPAYGGHRWPLKVPSTPNDSMMLWS